MRIFSFIPCYLCPAKTQITQIVGITNYPRGRGLGLGVGLGVVVGLGDGFGIGVGLPLGLGTGTGSGLGAGFGSGLGVCVGAGLGVCDGVGFSGTGWVVGLVELGISDGVVVDCPRRVLPRRVRARFAGAAGVAPASPGLATVVPAAAAFCLERRAALRDVVNEQGVAAPGTEVSVRRLPEWCARNETICGAVVAAPVVAPAVVAPAMSPVCSATAV
jgi:hypothetical protein